MLDRAFELTMKSISGEELTDAEKKYMRERNAKYELVRYVYMEKMKHEGSSITQFHFTPGESFIDTPIIDIVNDLMKINESIKNGDYEIADWDDVDGPPKTGRKKTKLGE